MFEQTQATTQTTSEVSNNSFMKVLSDYRIPNKSNGSSPYIIKTGFEIIPFKPALSNNSTIFNEGSIASISVTYGDSTFGVMMLPDESGRVKFERTPQYAPDIQTQTSVSEQGAKTALEAMAKYIEKNQGKKYGSFFGLMRNSNSFVKYVLKHTNDDHAKMLGKLHSPFTPKRALNKVLANANSNFNISVQDLRTPVEGKNLVNWMSTSKQYFILNNCIPGFFNTLNAICTDELSRRYTDEKKVSELHEQVKNVNDSFIHSRVSEVLEQLVQEHYISSKTAYKILSYRMY